MSQESNKKELDLPYLAIIPYAVLSDKDLLPAAKIYYGCLVGLSKKQGYCWATDASLAFQQGVDERTIKRWNKSLEEKGFIVRMTKNVPIKEPVGKQKYKKERKILIADGFSNKKSEGDKSEQDTDVPFSEGDTDVPYNSKPRKEESLREKEGGKPPNPPPAPKKPSPKKYGRAMHIETTNDEHENLAQAPYSPELRDQAYQILSEWKEDTPKSKWKKSDANAITRWVFDSIKEKQLKGSKGKSRANTNTSPEQQKINEELF